MLTTETTTTLPPLVVALVDVVAGQTGKASEGSSHEKAMGERGAMWWTAPPSLPCPDEDLVQSVLNLQKQPLREKGITKEDIEDIWFQLFDVDIKALFTSFNATFKVRAKI